MTLLAAYLGLFPAWVDLCLAIVLAIVGIGYLRGWHGIPLPEGGNRRRRGIGFLAGAVLLVVIGLVKL